MVCLMAPVEESIESPNGRDGETLKTSRTAAGGWGDRRHGRVLHQGERTWTVGDGRRCNVVHHDGDRCSRAATGVAGRDGVGCRRRDGGGCTGDGTRRRIKRQSSRGERETDQDVTGPPFAVGVTVVMAVPFVSVNELGLNVSEEVPHR